MATPIVSLSEEDASWMPWDPNVETVWPEAAAPSPQPIPSPPAPIEEKPEIELSWQELRATEDERMSRVAAAARENYLAAAYAHLPFSEKNWGLDGRLRCRVVGLPCYGKEHRTYDFMLNGRGHQVLVLT
ncbi:hypothetical protein FPANT_1452 [Fusarium pseudoanthophilum]|uniref:Uncharacterized protein n=1 Tax=Fusarium pseudoanthophilum TaxID=48495 RepID=A0A8H5PYE9_9HYPO|nr:hypothetical protein FPANT_1452 [Fusarium pseudoanthophilum]